MIRRGFLDALQHAAGFGDEREVGGVDAANARQPCRREDHLGAAGIGHRAADEPGVAALGDDRRAVGATGLDDGSDFGGRPGPDDGERAAVETPPPVDLVGRGVSADEHLRRADHGTEVVEHAHRGFSTRRATAALASSSTRVLMAANVPRRRGRRRRAVAPGRGCSTR